MSKISNVTICTECESIIQPGIWAVSLKGKDGDPYWLCKGCAREFAQKIATLLKKVKAERANETK